MPWSNQPVVAPLVVIPSGAPTSGLFVYSGTPAPGNPPVFAVVAPGVTKDPYGNSVLAVVTVGSAAGAHIQMDQFGDLVAQAASGAAIWLFPAITGGGPAIAVYDSAGNLATSIAAAAGTDSAGHTIPAGIFDRDPAGTSAALLAGGVLYLDQVSSVGVNSGNIQGAADGGLAILSTKPNISSKVSRLALYPSKITLPTDVARIGTDQLRAWDPVAGYPTLETWHTPSFASAQWSGTARYRLTPDNRVALDIDATFTDDGTTHLASGTTMATLPAAYRPQATKSMPCGLVPGGAVLAANHVPEIQVGTGGGVFAVGVSTSAGGQTAELRTQVSFPLD